MKLLSLPLLSLLPFLSYTSASPWDNIPKCITSNDKSWPRLDAYLKPVTEYCNGVFSGDRTSSIRMGGGAFIRRNYDVQTNLPGVAREMTIQMKVRVGQWSEGTVIRTKNCIEMFTKTTDKVVRDWYKPCWVKAKDEGFKFEGTNAPKGKIFMIFSRFR